MADDGVAFDGRMAEIAPFGGAETAFVALAEALAARGHSVEVRNRCDEALTHNGVHWLPLARGMPETCDLYIGNRGHRVIGLVRRGETAALLAAQPGAISAQAAQCLAARLVSADLGRDRRLSRQNGPGLAAAWRGRDDPLRRPRPLSRRRAARAAAAARDLYLEPVARARLAARPLGRDGSRPRSPRRNCTSTPDRRFTVRSASAGRARWRRCSPAPTGSPHSGVRRSRAGRARRPGGGADRGAGHALPRRPRRDLLPGAGRGAGAGRPGDRDAAWRGRRSA